MPIPNPPNGAPRADFFDLVYQVARLIPTGRVTTFGAIARYLGSGLSARTVGWALAHHEQVTPEVPAHRVVNASGLLSGRHHFSPPEAMQQRLEKEGVAIKDNQVVDFKMRFWDPVGELM